jgi:hypothetical protein
VYAVDTFPYVHELGPELVRSYVSETARVLRPGGDLAILNFSYRDDPGEDAREIEALAAEYGFAVRVSGARPFRTWDGVAFHLQRHLERPLEDRRP